MTAGITIFCTGSEHHRRFMEEAITSCREHDQLVCAISDAKPRAQVDEFIQVPSAPQHASREFKTRFIHLTPFSEGYFLDPDTIVLHRLPHVQRVLPEGADIGMRVERASTLQRFVDNPKKGNWVGHEEVQHTLKLFGPGKLDQLHWNSGVIAYRRTPRSIALCDAWHSEWQRFKRVDQFSFIRATFRTGQRVAPLSREFNLRDTRCIANFARVSVIHYHAGKKAERLSSFKRMVHVAAQAGLPARFDVGIAWNRVALKGQLSLAQYLEIANEITGRRSRCNLLVFGMGYDTPLWEAVNFDGRTLFVEDDQAWALRASNACTTWLSWKYDTRVGIDSPAPPMPERLRSVRWDVIVIDGPRGFRADHPGRAIPIAWASELKPDVLYVHDFDRAWERECCRHFLRRRPSKLIPFDAAGERRVLARFDKRAG